LDGLEMKCFVVATLVCSALAVQRGDLDTLCKANDLNGILNYARTFKTLPKNSKVCEYLFQVKKGTETLRDLEMLTNYACLRRAIKNSNKDMIILFKEHHFLTKKVMKDILSLEQQRFVEQVLNSVNNGSKDESKVEEKKVDEVKQAQVLTENPKDESKVEEKKVDEVKPTQVLTENPVNPTTTKGISDQTTTPIPTSTTTRSISVGLSTSLSSIKSTSASTITSTTYTTTTSYSKRENDQFIRDICIISFMILTCLLSFALYIRWKSRKNFVKTRLRLA
jgi:hypothetical protein